MKECNVKNTWWILIKCGVKSSREQTSQTRRTHTFAKSTLTEALRCIPPVNHAAAFSHSSNRSVYELVCYISVFQPKEAAERNSGW